MTATDLIDLFRLDGKVAIVTGASYGLGVLFAEVLASAGADVVVTARSIDKLEDTRAMVEGIGRRCIAVARGTSRPTPTASAWWRRRWPSSVTSTSS